MYQERHLVKQKKKQAKRIMAFFLAVLTVVSIFAASDFMLPVSAQAANSDNGLSEHMINTVSPNHVKFNLFDYWMVERDTSSDNNNRPVQGGINEGHPLIFGGLSGNGPWNVWTGEQNHYNVSHGDEGLIRYGVYPGVVGDLLQDGYPALSLEDDYPDRGEPSFIDENGLQATLTESLAYLFDPDIENEYKAVYENVQGLVKYSGDGGYVYNSHENYAAFKESPGGIGTNGEASDGYFEVYDSWALMGSTSPNGQFFPFDGAEEVFKQNADGSFLEEDGHLVSKERRPTVASEANGLNHFMGLTMETLFLQPEGGKIDEDTPMSFTFSGDDDVWVFIDNVLVSDLGGVHDECFTVIDFETGMVYTGMTPVKLENGVLIEDTPTLKELKTQQQEGGVNGVWTWGAHGSSAADYREENGSFEQFCIAHNITSKSLKDIFIDAGQDGNQSWGDESGMSGNTFDQNTQHELKMFYLERGAGASNLVLEFNMLAVPASGVTKTDQDGRPVEGAEFALWPAKVSDAEKDENGNPAPLLDEDGLYITDKNKNGGEPICTAITDESGHLNFVTDKQKIISFQERAQNDEEFYYVLEETGRPTGYRSKGNISLYYSIYNENSTDGVLLAHNYWQTGAYTQAKLDVTMTKELYEYEVTGDKPVANTRIAPNQEASESEIEDYLDDGIIFAVPIKRIDKEGSLYEESNYHALYGTTNTGWTMMSTSIEDRNSVLEAAKEMERVMRETRQTGTIIAERNARQLFHVEITNIPGDVKLSYPYLMDSGKEKESLYNIAFYFAPNAETLEEVSADEIVRIGASTPKGEMFDRQYASQFYVSNTFNRVRVQKLDYHGDRLTGAEFTMYQAYSTQPRPDYLLASGEHAGLYYNPDVVNADGTLKSREEILRATPWDKGRTKAGGTAGAGGLDLDGAFIFPTKFDEYLFGGDQSKPYKIDPNDTSTYMEEGEYVIFETGAPSDGYLVNETPIAVTVNDDGVCADAGEINDGVRVGKYAGWILNAMTQFATEGVVDETLTFLSTTLKVRNEDGSLSSPVEGDIAWLNKYSNQNDRYIFLAEDVGRYVTDGRNLYQFTDAGTPQLQMRQNSDVTAQVILFEGDYADYTGSVTVNKEEAGGGIYALQGNATNGTLGFWLRKADTAEGEQTLDSVVIEGKTLEKGKDYHVYEPNVTDLSGYDDLSGLFSTETLVQVYDQSVGDLKVSKETENVAESSEMEDALFFYRVYGVYEHATKLVLAETENGAVKTNPDGTPVLNTNFTGTLNVRLRETTEGASAQMTATNIAVDFKDGVGMIYLEPTYSVEHIYIPENENHAAHGLLGLVETQITLEDETASGTGTETGHHIAFDTKHTHDITFTDGVGVLYHDPDFAIEKVTLDGVEYYAHPQEGQKSLTATSRFNYATIGQVQNLSTDSDVAVTFTEADGSASSPERVLTNAAEGPGQNVTVISDGNGGYRLEYSLPSDTLSQAVVGQFALHAGQTIQMEGLAGGTVYYVYEYAAGSGDEDGRTELVEKWNTEIEITPQGANESDKIEEVISEKQPDFRAAKGLIRTNTTQAVSFTNEAKVGSLTISKEIEGDGAPAGADFEFTVTLTDENNKPLTGEYSYTGSSLEGSGAAAPEADAITLDENGSATVTLSAGQKITIGNLPVGTSWAVRETVQDDYTVQATATDGAVNSTGAVTTTNGSATGAIIEEKEADTAAYVNTYAPAPTEGSLTIIKTVTGDGADSNKEFSFTAVIGGKTETFTLKNGESKTFANIPIGTEYTVTEEDYSEEGYTATQQKYSGTVSVDQNEAMLAFENKYEPISEPEPQAGSLKITKTVTGEGADLDKEFGFTAVIGTETYEFSLKNGESELFLDIPVGTEYTVTEADYSADGYTANPSNQTGAITGADEVTVAFTNTYTAPEPEPQTGDLAITKSVVGENADPENVFSFEIAFSGEGAPESPQQFTLKAGETKTFSGIPAGVQYEVKETDAGGYLPVTGAVSGTVAAGTTPHTFVNRVPEISIDEPATLVVTKKLAGSYPAADQNKAFGFTLTMNGVETQFALKDGEKLEIELAPGASYELREEDYSNDGYSTSITNGSGTVQSGQTIEAVVTNTFSGSGIDVTISGEKTWDLNGAQIILPDFITVHLTGNGQIVQTQQVVPDAQGEWKYTFTAPKYDADGSEIAYGIMEEPTDGFKAAYDRYNIRNTYIVPIEFELPVVQKEIIGDNAPDETFTFLLEGADGAPMPEDAVDSKLQIKITGRGEAKLGIVNFGKEGTYIYTITEQKGGKAGWSYDSTVYTLVVTVSEEDGKLVAETELTGKLGQTDTVLFANQWVDPASEQPDGSAEIGGSSNLNGGNHEPGNIQEDSISTETDAGSVQTGDNANMTAWIILLIAACVVITIICVPRMKARDKH